MQEVSVGNARNGYTVGDRVSLAITFWARLRGLLGYKKIAPGEGLWLIPCRQVHMFGMSYAISAWFLDEENRVLAILDELAPGTVSPLIREAKSVLEFPAGWAQATETRVGDLITNVNPLIEG